MATDDLRERLAKALGGATPLDTVEAIARAHASERVESFALNASYCPFCGGFADDPHREDCAMLSPEPHMELWGAGLQCPSCHAIHWDVAPAKEQP